MRILVAEDDPTSQCILTRMLNKWGFDVVLAQDGAHAWEIARQPDSPRLVMLDIVMPEVDGLEVCRRMRGLDRSDPFYVIMVTSLGRTDNIIDGFRAGADDYVTKPFDHKILRWRIDAGIRLLKMRDDLAEQNNRLHQYATEMEQLAEERAQQLIHADRLATVGTLSAGIAHEITNPVAYIAMNIRDLERYWTTLCETPGVSGQDELQPILAETPKIYRALHKGVTRIQRIVDGLRLYARRDTNHFSEIDINACVREALMLCENRLRNSIHTDIELSENLPQVLGSMQELEQVLVNLFINAADAMEGGVDSTLKVSTQHVEGQVRITITDSGPGIPETDLLHVFKPFYTTKDPGKGTGMGLAICQSILGSHQGSIEVRNLPEGGACFTLSFPVAGEDPIDDPIPMVRAEIADS